MSAGATDSEVAIWNRTIQPDVGDLSPAAAEAMLVLKLAPADVQRVNELSAKAREGSLQADEARELDRYLNVARTLELLKAKARFSLRRAGHSR